MFSTEGPLSVKDLKGLEWIKAQPYFYRLLPNKFVLGSGRCSVHQILLVIFIVLRIKMQTIDTGSSPCRSDFSPGLMEEMYHYLGNSLSVDQTQSQSTMPSFTGLSPTPYSNQLVGSRSTQYSCSPGFGLSFTDLDSIREHLETNGKLNESKKMSLAWLIHNISILPSLIPRSGSYLEHLLGREYVFVKDALMALDLLQAYGIITSTELAMSEDAHVLSQANPHDRLTFHSLANVIRNILKERPEA